jgi:histidinol-phosphate phosphatase family protein
MSFAEEYIAESAEVLRRLDTAGVIEKLAQLLAAARARGGRLFILGVGGSAANASHAVNDFRKICGMEAYCPTDNVSELTARTNDEGWASVFESWLRVSRLRADDCVLVFSVGGGNLEKQVSPNLVSALRIREVRGRGHWRRDRPPRWLHGASGGRLRDRPGREPGAHHAARRSLSGGRLALAGDASRAESRRDPLGIAAMKRAVFLDRDGVLTRALIRDGQAYAPVTPAEMEIDADAPAALARLKAAGFLLVVVTNQPDVARGIIRREDVETMHATLRAALPLDACFVCYHDDADGCDCRKPRPGMLLQAAAAARHRSGRKFHDRRPLARRRRRRRRGLPHRLDRPRLPRARPRAHARRARRELARGGGVGCGALRWCGRDFSFIYERSQ